LKALAEIIISLFELAEAEGRELRRNVSLLLAASSLFFAASVVAIAGALALMRALYRVMSPSFGEIASLAATGAVSIFVSAAACAAMLWHINKKPGGKDDDKPDGPSAQNAAITDGGEGGLAEIDESRQPGGGD
jgi:hypothetical protein